MLERDVDANQRLNLKVEFLALRNFSFLWTKKLACELNKIN
jgi:hypothetical protein